MTDTTTTTPTPTQTEPVSILGIDFSRDSEGNWDIDGDGVPGFDPVVFMSRGVKMWTALAVAAGVYFYFGRKK